MAKHAIKQKSTARKLRMEIVEEESQRKIFSFAATRGRFRAAVVSAAVVLVAATYCLTAFTGLRRTIPGYPSSETRNTALANAVKIDSLEKVIDQWNFQLANIQRIVTGREPLTLDSVRMAAASVPVSPEVMAGFSKSDSLLREQVKNEEKFDIRRQGGAIKQIEGLHFYPPVKGIVTQGFNPAIGHPCVEVSAPALTPVCAVLDGTVISSGWNDLYGFTITIQHDINIISIYKHNEKLIKKAGDKVTAGMPVAIIGNTGELSSGVGLRFELWHEGEAADPARYITF